MVLGKMARDNETIENEKVNDVSVKNVVMFRRTDTEKERISSFISLSSLIYCSGSNEIRKQLRGRIEDYI